MSAICFRTSGACRISLFFLHFMIFGCTFEPDTNFVRIDPTPQVKLLAANLSTKDLMTSPDTITLIGRTTNFTASFRFANYAEVTGVRVLIDGKYISGSSTSSVNFSIYAPDYTDGYHKIRLEGVTNTGTGSLADKSGNELLDWFREWTFKLERISPPPLKIIRAFPENGRLVIEWEQSDVPTEKLIQVELGTSPYGNNSLLKWSYWITDPNQTRVVDTLFIDEKLKVTLTNQSIDPALASPSTSLSAQFPELKIIETSWDGNGNISLKCNRSLFYRNVAKYSVEWGTLKINSRTGADTTINTSLMPFWGTKAIYFRTTAKNALEGYNDTLKTRVGQYIDIGEKSDHSWEAVVYSATNPTLGFGLENSGKTILVLENDKVVQKLTNDTLSVSGRSMAVTNDGSALYVGYNGRIIRIDRSGAATIALDTRQLNGKAVAIGTVSLGGDRYLCFDDSPFWSSRVVNTYVFDLQTSQTVTLSDPDISYNNSIRQSSDGRYLVLHDRRDINIYTIDDGVLTKKKNLRLSDNPDFSFFDKTSPQILGLVNWKQIGEYDIESDAEIVWKDIQGFSSIYAVESYELDPITGLVGYRSTGYYNVVDPKIAKIIRKILIEPYSTEFSLYNGSLYSGIWKYDFKL